MGPTFHVYDCGVNFQSEFASAFVENQRGWYLGGGEEDVWVDHFKYSQLNVLSRCSLGWYMSNFPIKYSAEEQKYLLCCLFVLVVLLVNVDNILQQMFTYVGNS